jgi:hypothetical protein
MTTPVPSQIPSIASRQRPALALNVLGVGVSIRHGAAWPRALLAAHYGCMRGPVATADLTYTIAGSKRTLLLAGDGDAAMIASDPGALILLLDQDLIVQLQRRRPDLYFVHAGVLERGGRALMLVAPSGGGKSTTVWGLVHHGFRYLSDELAPIDVHTMTVHPYPRAITLKRLPPRAYPLPGRARSTSRGVHVPTDALAGGVGGHAVPLAAVFFLRYTPDARGPAIERIGTAQAGARLYANALNALAHPGDGLDAALAITARTACFQLSTADLAATCALVKATLDDLRRPGARTHKGGPCPCSTKESRDAPRLSGRSS